MYHHTSGKANPAPFFPAIYGVFLPKQKTALRVLSSTKTEGRRKGLEKEEREKEITFPEKVFPSRILPVFPIGADMNIFKPSPTGLRRGSSLRSTAGARGGNAAGRTPSLREYGVGSALRSDRSRSPEYGSLPFRAVRGGQPPKARPAFSPLDRARTSVRLWPPVAAPF